MTPREFGGCGFGVPGNDGGCGSDGKSQRCPSIDVWHGSSPLDALLTHAGHARRRLRQINGAGVQGYLSLNWMKALLMTHALSARRRSMCRPDLQADRIDVARPEIDAAAAGHRRQRLGDLDRFLAPWSSISASAICCAIASSAMTGRCRSNNRRVKRAIGDIAV